MNNLILHLKELEKEQMKTQNQWEGSNEHPSGNEWNRD